MANRGLNFEVKEFSEEGEFEGYASIFNKVDMGGDTILPGAFKATLADMKKQGRILPLLFGHNQSDIIGGIPELEEDKKGLKIRGRVLADISDNGRKAYMLMKSKLSTALSIGYQVPDGGAEKKEGNRIISKLNLYEVSFVGVGMDPYARVTSVKGLKDIRAKLAAGERLTEREFEVLFKHDLNLTNSEAERAVRVNLKNGEGDPRTPTKETDVLKELRRLI